MAFTEEFMPKDLIKAESEFGRVGALGGEYHMILRGQTGLVAICKPGREVSWKSNRAGTSVFDF